MTRIMLIISEHDEGLPQTTNRVLGLTLLTPDFLSKINKKNNADFPSRLSTKPALDFGDIVI